MSSGQVVVLAIPPLVGAAIGLFTNWLAIKMLFRPLLEKRILGLRVPFTPGILPRERKRLARSLGETVAVDLLDTETVADRLRSPAFKSAVRQAALSTGHSALRAKPADIAPAVDSALFLAIKKAVLKAIASMAGSEPFRNSVVSGVDAAIAASMDVPLADLVNPAVFRRIANVSSDAGVADGVAKAISLAIIGLIEKLAENGSSIVSIIEKERLESFISNTLGERYHEIVAGIMEALGDKHVVATMEKAGSRIMRKAIDRMNAIQRFFIGLGQYDRAILESMPETIADLNRTIRDTLSNPATKAGIIDRAKALAIKFAEKPLADLRFVSDTEVREKAVASLTIVVAEAISKVGPESITEMLRKLLAGGTIGDVARTFPELKDKLGPALAFWLAGLFGRDPGSIAGSRQIFSVFFSSFTQSFFQSTSGTPLGETLDVDEDDLKTLAGAAADGFSELAAKESTTMLESIDIRSLVVDKIDSLDMIQVERMLLKVIDKELGAITIFGGFLGAIIGMAQSVFLLLR